MNSDPGGGNSLDKSYCIGSSLPVQWLGLHTFTPEGLGSIPGRGTSILQAKQHGQKKKKKLGIWVLHYSDVSEI